MTSGKTTDSVMLQDFALYRQLFSGYVWRYRGLFLIAVGLMLSAALTNLGLVSLIKPLTEEVITVPDVQSYGIPVLIVFAVLLRALCTSLGESATQSVSLRITRDLRHDLFTRLLYLPIGHFDQVQSGSLIARFTHETTIINRCVADTISILFKDLPTIVALVAFMIYSNWLFAIVALLSAPAITFTLLKFRRFLREAHHEIQGLTGGMIAAADQAMRASRIVRVYGGQATERERFDQIIRDHYRSSVRATRGALLSRFLLQAMLCIPILILIVLVVVYSQSSVGELLSFFVVFLMLVPPVRKLSMVNAALQQVLAALESIQAVMRQPLEPDNGTLNAAGSRGTLQMRNVSFCYPGRDTPALQAVSLHIQTGETVAAGGGLRQWQIHADQSAVPGSMTRAPGVLSWMAMMCVTTRWNLTDSSWPWSARRWCCSTTQCATMSPMGKPPTAVSKNCNRPSGQPMWMSSCNACRMTWTVPSVRTGRCYPVGNASASLSPGHC